MSALNERQAFSQRLTKVLMQNGYAPQPTTVSREFNLRYRTGRISAHAVRKWLLGDAIPAQDKLQVLAEWLGVTAQWLRFGEVGVLPELNIAPAKNRDSRVFVEFCKLDEAGKLIVEDLILSLLRRLPHGSVAASPDSGQVHENSIDEDGEARRRNFSQ